MVPLVVQVLIQKLQISSSPKRRIIFPEGNSLLIQKVANDLVIKKLGDCFLVFNSSKEVPSNINSQIHPLIIDQFDLDKLALQLFELRKGKITLQQSKILIQQRNYFAMMMVKTNKVDCFLGGLDCSTADILRPAFQIIKTKKTVVATSAFLMSERNHNFIFADCALTVDPAVSDLVNIAKNSINLADELGFQEKKTAMLSFSTAGSGGNNPTVSKVKEATTILNSELPKTSTVLGEIQFDAAFSELVRKKKWKSQIHNFSGSANIFIFPDLNSANIGYKIAQHLGNYTAVGPIIIGLNSPVNDLSRGATEEDIYYTAIITLSQVKNKLLK